MIGIGIADSLGVNLSGLNPATKSFVTSAGISDASTVTTINNLVNGLQASGLWSKMKAVYPFVTDNRNLLAYTTTWVSPWIGGMGTTGQADPFGGTTATLGNGSEIYQAYAFTNSVAYTQTVYAKAAAASIFTFGTDITSARFSTFDLSNQTVTNNAGYTGSITSVGNGWYRCSVTFIYNVGGSFAPYFDMKPTGGTMYFSSPQLEKSPTATTYQPIATTQQAYISNQFKYNLKDPRDLDAAFRLVFNGGWTFANTGATPNGVNGYADTKLIPSSVLAQNSNHLSYYSRTAVAASVAGEIGSVRTIPTQSYFHSHIRYTGDIYYMLLASNTIPTVTNTNSQGFFNGSRTNSTSIAHFRNGVNLANVASTSVALNSLNVFIGSLNIDGTPSNFSTKQTAFSTIGDGLTDDDATNLYYYTQVFQTSLGRQIGSPAYALPNTYDANAKIYLSAIGSTTNNTFNNAINTFITGLKADGIYSKMKAVYPFATDNVNLAGYSEDITNITGWNSVTMTRTANTTVAPNGTLTADTFTTVSNGNNAVWNLGWIAGNGQTFTNSIYLKYNNAQWVTLEIWEGSGQNGIRLWVDIQNGVLGTANATVGTFLTSSILNVGNGWYRVSLTGIMPGVNNAILVVRHVDGNGAYNFTAVSGLSTYCWGAQNEVGNLTTYQPQLGTAQSYFANQFKFNMINPQDDDTAFRLVFNGGWTHSPQGATPNGVNAYADTYLIPSSVLAQNNASLGYYGGATGTSFKAALGSGNLSTTNYFNIYPAFPSFGLFGDINDGSNTFTANTNSAGFILASRLSATQKKHFIRNVANTLTENSVAPNSFKVFVGARNTSGTATDYFDKQIRYSFIGDGLTDTEAANLYTRVQAFQTSLSRQV